MPDTASLCKAATDLSARVTDLLRPAAFPHPALDPCLIETHISWVILAGERVYKIRKPVTFGVLDFSTLEQRRADCEAELRLNQRLCPDLYLGVVDVVERDGRLSIAGPGKPIEPAVCMRRLPTAGMLPALVERGVADDRLMCRLARQLADFHAEAATGAGIDEHGTCATVRANWIENLEQTTSFIGRTLRSDQHAAIRTYVEDFLERNELVLAQRVQQGRVREGHGDLHANSVCLARRRLYLFDCIEFNNRFRCGDVASEVAFLAMDLDHLGRADLAGAFVDAYVRRSGDRDLVSLLDFYKCYRAFVRGKVLSFALDEPVGSNERERAAEDARAYFEVAHAYTRRSAQPSLVVTLGLPASGKTTLARALAARLALVHLSSDVMRKHLHPTDRAFDRWERGLYRPSMSRRTYAGLRRQAAKWLRRGQSVVLDGTYGRKSERAALRQLARRSHAHLLFVVCRTNEGVLRTRPAARAQDPLSVSEARPELWPRLKAPLVEPAEEPAAVAVDTDQPLEQGIEQVIRALDSDQGRSDSS